MAKEELNNQEELQDEATHQEEEEIKETTKNDDSSEGELSKDEERIQELEEKNNNLEDQILRLQAEIQNIQRRNAKERQDAAKYRSQKLAGALLETIDNLERALALEVETEEAEAVKKGVQMAYDQFINAFNNENITVIDPVGEAFDPNYHQAVSTVAKEEDQESDIVVNVLQKGYLLEDRVIRPAMVIVAQ
ncbi:nucleotide exchange factor GrpE [Dolosicoccus paucivorans]|uniref:Protein GrpE n=1 Tax=Dolosicoccus paucivorans TaxID=84521 RepID=A0A2N6SPY7_9LACT|nr:nucleotide exchange factor GrpE [Dolosicoccus paucivorans]PMB84134.1 nucleotide exchange factor GrpE [Dolosicoccus paucivorans]PMC59106.1 nucleotide exchange factor GrpE [Dolosicoccus paucivorans]